MIFSENRLPLFRIMLKNAAARQVENRRHRYFNRRRNIDLQPRRLAMTFGKIAASAAVLSALSAAGAAAAPALATNNVNLRQGPGTTYTVIMTIPGGSNVDVNGCSGQWCQVTFQGQHGYAIATSFDQGGPPPGVAGPPPAGYAGPAGPPPAGYAPPPPPGYAGPPPGTDPDVPIPVYPGAPPPVGPPVYVGPPPPAYYYYGYGPYYGPYWRGYYYRRW
jgi:hypothetical protein